MQLMAAAAITDRVIDVETLFKQYDQVTALRGVSLSIPRGSIYGLIGSNGAGKTTLIRILMGLSRPTAGQVTVLGQDVRTSGTQIRRLIGYVPENHHLYSWMTVGSLLRFVRSFYPTWDDRISQDLLRLFSINARQKIKHLSKGSVVKLALLIAVAHEAPLLILDEPTSGLDPLVRADFLAVLEQRHHATGQTVLFSSHILSDIQAVATDVGILHGGRLLASGSIGELQQSMRMIRTSLPTDGQAIVPTGRTLWHTQKDGEYWLAVANYDESAIDELKTKNRVSVIGVREVTLDEVYLYHVQGAGHRAIATTVERRPA
jgi:ABC-2 type transport system ATP-binding protein